jgi:hypothetical protein
MRSRKTPCLSLELLEYRKVNATDKVRKILIHES